MKSTWTYVQFAIYIAPLYQRGGGGWEMSGRGQCPDTFANVWMSGGGNVLMPLLMCGCLLLLTV